MSFLSGALGSLINRGLTLPTTERPFLDQGLSAYDTFAPPGSGVTKMGETTPYASDFDVLNPFGKIGSPDALGGNILDGGGESVFQGGKMSPWNLNPQVFLPSLAAPPQSGGGSLPPGTGPGGGSMPSGSIGSFSDNKSVLNQYDAYFQKAASTFGVSANDLKAIAGIEQGWGAGSISPSGAVGIMQVMPQYWGDKGYDINTTEGNIMAGALAYKTFYDQYHDEAIARGMDPSVAAARAYLAGNPWSTARDDFGTGTDDYGSRFIDYRTQLGGSSTTGGGGTASIATLFGGAAVPDWGEFNAPSGNGLYGYGNQYGLDGNSHTGVDVPMQVGAAYRAPMSGTVMCAGTGVGSGTDGGGCSAFNDYYGQGAGRVEVLLDNGAVLIYGHSSTSALKPGDKFTAGTVLGTSGGMNSPHIHLEARVRDSSTPSGWRIVDPRSVIGNGQIPSGPGSVGYTPGGGQQSQAQRLWGHATGNY